MGAATPSAAETCPWVVGHLLGGRGAPDVLQPFKAPVPVRKSRKGKGVRFYQAPTALNVLARTARS